MTLIELKSLVQTIGYVCSEIYDKTINVTQQSSTTDFMLEHISDEIVRVYDSSSSIKMSITKFIDELK